MKGHQKKAERILGSFSASGGSLVWKDGWCKVSQLLLFLLFLSFFLFFKEETDSLPARLYILENQMPLKKKKIFFLTHSSPAPQPHF